MGLGIMSGSEFAQRRFTREQDEQNAATRLDVDPASEHSSITSPKALPGNARLAGRKVVQTDLGEKEYEMLSATARDKGLTIKEAARKALVDWSTSELDLREDPLFQLKPVRFKEKIRVLEIDKLLYSSK